MTLPTTKAFYHVHLYRVMCLSFGGIAAETPERAAAIARDRPTEDADSIDDCDGETLAALVDLDGDVGFERSRMIDFEGECLLQFAPRMLACLRAFLEADALAEECGEWKWENLEHTFAQARAVVAGYEAACRPGGAGVKAR